MREIHTLPACQAAYNKQNLEDNGFKVTLDNGLFVATCKDGTIYGMYDNGICSIFTDRTEGNSSAIFKRLDKLHYVDAYGDDFEDVWFHSNWTQEETLMKMQQEVQHIRKELGLQEVQP